MAHLSNTAIERRADAMLSGQSREGAAMREAAGKRSMKLQIGTSFLTGLADSTQKMGQIEAKSVQKTGVGYKAWAGLGLLLTGAIAGIAAEDSSSHKTFKQLEAVADASLTLSTTAFSLESYNLGVTRLGRVRQAAEQIVNRVSGIPAGAYRPGLPERVGALSRGQARRTKRGLRMAGVPSGIAEYFIEPNDREGIAEIFGISDEEQDSLFSDLTEQFLPVA